MDKNIITIIFELELIYNFIDIDIKFYKTIIWAILHTLFIIAICSVFLLFSYKKQNKLNCCVIQEDSVCAVLCGKKNKNIEIKQDFKDILLEESTKHKLNSKVKQSNDNGLSLIDDNLISQNTLNTGSDHGMIVNTNNKPGKEGNNQDRRITINTTINQSNKVSTIKSSQIEGKIKHKNTMISSNHGHIVNTLI